MTFRDLTGTLTYGRTEAEGSGVVGLMPVRSFLASPSKGTVNGLGDSQTCFAWCGLAPKEVG